MFCKRVLGGSKVKYESIPLSSPVRVWIDILTPKQALFFKPLVDALSSKGHETILTTRKYEEVEALLKALDIEVEPVGRHGGEAMLGKLEASAERVLTLARLISNTRPDAAVCFASPECARTAFGLQIPLVCVNDSPHSDKVARLTVPLVSVLLSPWVIPPSVWVGYGIPRDRVVTYHALDPAAWLKRNIQPRAEAPYTQIDMSKKTLAVRLEEAKASYLSQNGMKHTTSILDTVLGEVADCNIVVLARDQDQRSYIKERYGDRVVVLEAFFGPTLLRSVDVLIGMGGTMTVEAALMGVPSISA